ncbi:diphthamide synthesis protein [Candidatus Woesearchaeota archaeon]|nr:diphthamide synthesis protein [Candidatus Woesearchaeota archaeon]
MYDLEEEKIIAKVNEKKCKTVLLQFPDGLKTQAGHLAHKIEQETGALVLIWFGSNFGACDLPIGIKSVNIDLIVAFGHNVYVKEVRGW